MSRPAWKGRSASLLDEARKLWQKVSTRSRSGRGADAAAAADVRLEAISGRVHQLEQDADASFDVVRGIAQQHSNLSEQHAEVVQALDEALSTIERLGTNLRRLTWACAALGALALVALVLAAAT